MLIGTEVLTPAGMRAVESAAIASGQVSGLTLMRRAGQAVAGHIRLRWPVPGHAVILCGPGNNGGDGYVIACELARAGWRVRVLGTTGQSGSDAQTVRAGWLQVGPIVPLTLAALLDGPSVDILVDAIFGTGLTRPPEGEIARLLDHIHGANWAVPVVAVDCPSGLCLDSGVFLRDGAAPARSAQMTVAFDSPKPGHLLASGPVACGALIIADIGLGPWRKGQVGALTALWPRFGDGVNLPAVLAKESAVQPHKFSHGHAVVIAGPAGRGGAARLAARAALRIGAGLVTLAPPAGAMPEHAGPPDALMRHPLDHAEGLQSLLADPRIAAICIGPGGGVARTQELLPVLLQSRRPCVLDADAITALAAMPDRVALLHEACILTPHGGEFARLFPDLAERLSACHVPAFSRLDAARAAAARCGVVMVLKGPDTVIAAPDGRGFIHSAFDIPWLATAGAGDVLAGIITGLLARGIAPFEAAGLGVLAHAQAARLHGPGLIADDLPDLLVRVLGG